MIRWRLFGTILILLLVTGSASAYQLLEAELKSAQPELVKQLLGTLADKSTEAVSPASPTASSITQSVVLGTSSAKTSLTIATISSVVDGDTVTLSTGQKLRYIGMDTPEIHHPTKGKQCFGEEAKSRNAELVTGKTVWLEKDVSETDRYGRLLRYVWLGDTLINQQLVTEGYAVAISYPPDIARQPQLRQAEAHARQQNLGLWQSCPIPEGKQ